MAVHVFEGKWISDETFANRLPRNIYHKQLQPLDLPADEHANAHILFRKKFALTGWRETAKLYITALQSRRVDVRQDRATTINRMLRGGQILIL